MRVRRTLIFFNGLIFVATYPCLKKELFVAQKQDGYLTKFIHSI